MSLHNDILSYTQVQRKLRKKNVIITYRLYNLSQLYLNVSFLRSICVWKIM